MERMTAQLLREILQSVESDIETLEMDEVMTEGEEVPTPTECAAIDRAQKALQQAAFAIRAELALLE